MAVNLTIKDAAIFSMSLTLHGEIAAICGAVEHGKYDTYPVIRMSEAPRWIPHP